jgi:hypothetical protein
LSTSCGVEEFKNAYKAINIQHCLPVVASVNV